MSDILQFLAIIIPVIFTVFGSVLVARINTSSQMRMKEYETRANTAESAHASLKQKVDTESERAGEIIRTQQENYEKLLSFTSDLGGKYTALMNAQEERRTQLMDVTLLSERQKVQIEMLERDGSKAVEAANKANDIIGQLKLARDEDHRNFEDQVSTLNNENDRKQRDLKLEVDRLTEKLEFATQRITQLEIDLDSTKHNMEKELKRIQEELEQAKSDRDQAIAERDEYKRQLEALQRADPVSIAVAAAVAQPPPL